MNTLKTSFEFLDLTRTGVLVSCVFPYLTCGAIFSLTFVFSSNLPQVCFLLLLSVLRYWVGLVPP